MHFADEHKDFFMEAASSILAKKRQSWDDYVWCMLQEKTPFDEIAIYIASVCMKIQTRIFASDTVWTTKGEEDVSDSFDFNLVYKEELAFFDTVAISMENPNIAGHALKVIENGDFASTVPVDIVVVAVVPAESSVEPKTVAEIKKEIVNISTAVQPKRRKRKKKKKTTEENSAPEKNPKKSAPLAVQLRSSSKREFKHDSETSKKAREAARLLEKSIATTKGLLSVKTYAIQKCQKQRRKIKCQYCGEVYYSQRSFNKHMEENHPDIRYKCRWCSREFKTYNGRLKRLLIHKGYSYQCDVCFKTFPYPSRLKEHSRRHTRRGVIPCITKGCPSTFTTKRALKQHMQVHDDTTHKCDSPSV